MERRGKEGNSGGARSEEDVREVDVGDEGVGVERKPFVEM